MRPTSQTTKSAGSIFAVVCDLNGCLRGKRYPETMVNKLLEGGFRMPMSSMGVDIWGSDVLDNALVLQGGDQDGICVPTDGRIRTMAPSGLLSRILPMWMHLEDGCSFNADPRRALARVLEWFAAAKLTPVVATELEFYLVDASTQRAQPIKNERGRVVSTEKIYSVADLNEV